MNDRYWSNEELFTRWQLHKELLLQHFKLEKQIDLLKAAIDLVEELHAEPRLDGVGIANVHLLRVPRILVEEMEENNIDTILTGVLHDVVEDTSYPQESLEKDFGKSVLEGVKILSRPRDKDWVAYANDVINHGNISLIKVKIADKLDNARSHALSDNEKLRSQDFYKTTVVMKPIIDLYYPSIWSKFEEVLARWDHR